MVNVLFTSAGRRFELLRAFRRAYKSLRLEGQVVALDADPLAPALSVAERVFIVPKLSSPGYISAVASICRDQQIHLVFPLIDPDIPLLVDNRAEIESSGAKVIAIPAEFAHVTADKLRTHALFERIGIRSPRYWLPQEIASKDLHYPLFIKPRSGSAGKYAFKVTSPEELDFFTRYVPNPIIEEFLPGPEVTSDVLCDLHGEVLSVVCRERIEVRSGEVQKGVTVYNESIIHSCVDIARAIGGLGQITVQCIMKDALPYFTEVNARFGGGTPLGIAAGCNGPKWLLAQAAGLPAEVPPLGQYRVGLYISRHDDSLFFTRNDLEKISGSHI